MIKETYLMAGIVCTILVIGFATFVPLTPSKSETQAAQQYLGDQTSYYMEVEQ